MSDTPKTDAMMTALLWRTGETLIADVEFADFARQLERENAALREAFAKADVLAEYMRSDGRREWQTIECWVYPNDIIVQMDRAAFDAARKEAQPCQCTNGVIRSVGRDNDEVIEDCPDCSGSKEVQP